MDSIKEPPMPSRNKPGRRRQKRKNNNNKKKIDKCHYNKGEKKKSMPGLTSGIKNEEKNKWKKPGMVRIGTKTKSFNDKNTSKKISTSREKGRNQQCKRPRIF